ncbi:cell envelope integrity TolA family protein [Bartonella sp. LJL80]
MNDQRPTHAPVLKQYRLVHMGIIATILCYGFPSYAKVNTLSAELLEPPRNHQFQSALMVVDAAQQADKKKTPAAHESKVTDDGRVRLFQMSLSSCLRANFERSIKDEDVGAIKISAHFFLNEDGTVKGTPDVTAADGNRLQQQSGIEAFKAAIAKCSPFPLPADTDEKWREIDIDFNPFAAK